MDLHLGALTGTDLELGYSGTYQGATTVDAAGASAGSIGASGDIAVTASNGGTTSSALSVTGAADQNEIATGSATSTLTAEGLPLIPAGTVLELGSLSGTTLELGYIGSAAPSGTVYADGVATAALTSYVWPYALTAHGEAHPNSIMASAQFASTGPVQLGLPTGGDASVMVVDFDLMDKEQGWTSDIEQYATVYQDGQVTYTINYRVYETRATGSFDVTVDAYIVVEAGAAATSALVSAAQPSVDRDTAGTAAGAGTATGGAIFTQDASAAEQSALSVTASADVDRRTAGAAGSTFTALNLGISVSSEGGSAVQSGLFSVGTAHADKVSGGAAAGQLTTSGTVSERINVLAAGSAAAALTETGEFVRTYSVGSATSSVLITSASAPDTVLAAGTSQAVGSGHGTPEVTRGATAEGQAVLSTAGDIAKGVSAAGTGTGALSTTGEGFIDRGFEIAADAAASATAAGTPVYDAVTDGATSSVASGAADPAVTRSVVGTSVADLFGQAVPGVDIEVSGTGSAQLTSTGDAEAGLVIRAEGAGTATGTGQAVPAKTIDFVGAGTGQLAVVGQGATNQEGAGNATMVLRIAAETTGGTPVEPRLLTAHRVAIFPSMSCYTKVTPSMYGNGAIRPR